MSAAAALAPAPIPQDLTPFAEAKNLFAVIVKSVHHWNGSVFSFTTERPQSFRFRSGEFIMIGLPVEGKPLLRAYSVVSPAWEEHLEFLSIKVPDGPLTSRLQHIRPGDQILLGRKPTGTLVIDFVTPAKRLLMMSTGTGLAPFLSILRDPETFERFEEVVITHTVRECPDLAYRDFLERGIFEDEIFGPMVEGRFVYYPTCTREAFRTEGRITDLWASGRLAADLGAEGGLTPADTRVMLCGSMAFNRDMQAMLEAAGFAEGNTQHPGDYVLERAFVG